MFAIFRLTGFHALVLCFILAFILLLFGQILFMYNLFFCVCLFVLFILVFTFLLWDALVYINKHVSFLTEKLKK